MRIRAGEVVAAWILPGLLFLDPAGAVEQQRIWTHSNGRSIAGVLKKVEGREVTIEFGKKEITVLLDDLSIKDRMYLFDAGFLDHLKGDQEEDVEEGNAGDGDAEGEGGDSLSCPGAMVDFYLMLSRFRGEYELASNDLQRSSIRTSRQKEIEKQLKNRKVDSWIGEVVSLRTDSSRDAIITIKVDQKIIGREVGRDFCFVIRNSINRIEHGSQLYDEMSRLSVGSRLTFSGRFVECDEDYIREGSLTEHGAMSEPEFEFVFESR